MCWNQALPDFPSASPQDSHVIVGLSGGVDSAVAALLLKQQGYQVTGLFMKNWEGDDDDEYCSAEADLADASAVAEQLEIPLQTANFAGEYWRDVFVHFLDEHLAGRTPNPDILCNREIKFKAFLQLAEQLGGDYIATGHYAGTTRDTDGYKLTMAADRNKDQTYFLYMLGQPQLARSLFPLSQLDKPEIRRIAAEHKLPIADKKDSTGICFIGERPFREFLSEHLPDQPGDIVDTNGNRLGQHNGLMYYTIGQRQGLGIGGRRDHDEAPWFVAEKQIASNKLLAVQGHDHPLLLADRLTAIEPHWVAGKPPESSFTCLARSRHRQALETCQVSVVNEHAVAVVFDRPQRALTPGQSVVFYQDNCCLGGAVIDQVGTSTASN
ncbi:MAG: tRNA 2-thiouridine(34) synthase MnmA [Gammaproteobacteria bacterium]|nr:MAG: tRNA 2-thiouridine(34) synthase MnmA [Gammaproteobacteria bacterium]